MPSDKEPEPRQPIAIRIAIALMALVALSGIVMIGNGLYLMARAGSTQPLHKHGADHHLTEFRVIDPPALGRAIDL